MGNKSTKFGSDGLIKQFKRVHVSEKETPTLPSDSVEQKGFFLQRTPTDEKSISTFSARIESVREGVDRRSQQQVDEDDGDGYDSTEGF